MKTYKLELTAEQLKLVSQALGCYEQAAIKVPKTQLLPDEVFQETFWKVSDQMEQYYRDNGIED